METATILIIFVSTLLVGVTGYSVYSAFGPNALYTEYPVTPTNKVDTKIIRIVAVSIFCY
jgi:hypothetical protein